MTMVPVKHPKNKKSKNKSPSTPISKFSGSLLAKKIASDRGLQKMNPNLVEEENTFDNDNFDVMSIPEEDQMLSDIDEFKVSVP